MTEPVRVRLQVPADVRFARIVTSCLEQLLTAAVPAASAALSHDLQLALQETCVNIMVHAYAGLPPGVVIIEFELGPETLSIVITDRGTPFDPDQIPPPDLEAGQVHGYGLFLMRALLDEVRYEHVDGENRWRLSKRLP